MNIIKLFFLIYFIQNPYDIIHTDALKKITNYLLNQAESIFGLFASTAASCLGINILASDQYLAIVIPGKMFKDAFEEKNLSAVNLSRTLEDTSIRWNKFGFKK